mgnify:CR=1 FL=1
MNRCLPDAVSITTSAFGAGIPVGVVEEVAAGDDEDAFASVGVQEAASENEHAATTTIAKERIRHV